MFDQAKSWPFQEARSLLAHIAKKGKKPGDLVTFETGYGPSGAPHIGTFGEVVRTLWVMRAFRDLTDGAYPTRLIMFSDDYDAMRKVPDDMPEWMNEHLGQPLSSVPNPYPEMSQCVANDADQYAVSFADANNDRLVAFVDDILQTYNGSKVGSSPDRSRVSFVSSTRYYKDGKFNDMLDRVWDNYQAIQDVMLPTLGEERRATYSPFMPVMTPEWWPFGQVLQVPVELVNDHEIAFEVPDDARTRMVGSIHNGLTKLQWKVDWAMRWVHFDVDYEMSGKDLIDSVKASSQICRILGGTPPLNLTYEMFLDEQGAKISKSKGNGFTIEEWLQYGSSGSLQLLMFQNPRRAKNIFRDLVPKLEDEYIAWRLKDQGPDNPTWHFRDGPYDQPMPDVTFNLLLNLAIVTQTPDANTLVDYLGQGRTFTSYETLLLRHMAMRVLRYARAKGLFNRVRREPTDKERLAFADLAERFSAMLPNMDAEHFQFQVYEVGKRHDFQPLRSWFQALYECLLGSSDGPRFGAFTQAYGLKNTIALLRQYENEEA